VSEAIAKGEVASINYFITDKYLRALTEIVRSPNQKVLMFPIETTARWRRWQPFGADGRQRPNPLVIGGCQNKRAWRCERRVRSPQFRTRPNKPRHTTFGPIRDIAALQRSGVEVTIWA
jgi:hypothetical protein